jgi:hypothetical protein
VLAVSVRPAGYFLFGAVVLLALTWRGRRALVARWALLPLAGFTIVYVTIGLATRGIATQAFTGSILFPHVAYLYAGGGVPPQTERDVLQVLAAFQEDRARQPSWRRLADYERETYQPIQIAVGRAVGRTMPAGAINDALAAMALHAIVTHPVGYARLALRATIRSFSLRTLAAPWFSAAYLRTQYQASQPEIRPFFERFSGRRSDFDPADTGGYSLLNHYPIPQFKIPYSWRWPLQVWTLIVVAASTGLVLAGRARRVVVFTFYLGALLLGGYLHMGLSTAVIDRYAWPLDAFVFPIMLLGAWLAVQPYWRESVAASAQRPASFERTKL